MSRLLILHLFLLLSPVVALAQYSDWMVIDVKGKAFKGKQRLAKYDLLYSEDVITLEKGSIRIGKDQGQEWLINRAGTYDMQQLATLQRLREQATTDTAAMHLAALWLRGQALPQSNLTGSVSARSPAFPFIWEIGKVKTYKQFADFPARLSVKPAYQETPPQSPYQWELYNMFDEKLLSLPSSDLDTSLVFQDFLPKNLNPQSFIIQFSDEQSKPLSNKVAVQIEQGKELQKQLQPLVSAKDVLTKLILGMVLEENGYYLNAFHIYHEAKEGAKEENLLRTCQEYIDRIQQR